MGRTIGSGWTIDEDRVLADFAAEAASRGITTQAQLTTAINQADDATIMLFVRLLLKRTFRKVT